MNRLLTVSLSGQEITHHYYDTYPTDDFDGSHAFGQARKASTLGLPTATDQRILGTSTMLRTLTYYEEEGRVIQTSSQNHKGSIDRISLNLDFAGRVIDTKLTTLNGMTVLTHSSYDRGGRSKAVCQQVFDTSTPENGKYWEPVGRYGYNGIGEMTRKTLGCGIQNVDYAYNIRGWMTKMNDPAQLVQGEEKDFFGMALNYDAVGYITNWNYRSAQRTGAYADKFAVAPKEPFAYSFTYDNLYRIKTAGLTKSGSAVFALSGNESGAMGYDFNGNITSLKRTFNGSVVDDLTYSYAANTNKLSGVIDAGTNPATSNEFFAANSNYTYDTNGNLISDSGKGITNVAYNYLNLTQTVSKSGQVVNYTYDAGGQKLKVDFGSGKAYDYVAGLVYVNDSLEFIPTAEGRVLPPGRAVNPEDAVSNTFYRYEYQLKDHLGNLRVACRCVKKANPASPSDAYAPIVVQENHYDPWGLGLPLNQQSEEVGGSPKDRFTYNGKEKQKDLGWLDYGARMYNPAIGRWSVTDLLSEKYSDLSSYSYVADNPLKFIDPDGKDIILVVSRDAKGNADLVLRYQNNKFYNLDGSVYKQGALTGLSNRVLEALNSIRKSDSYLEKMISILESNKSANHIIEFSHSRKGSKVKGNEQDVDPRSSLMILDPDDIFEPLDSGEKSNLETTIAHELSHQYDRETGKRNRSVPVNDDGTERDPNEIRAVNVENRYRANNNIELRTHYGGKIDASKLEDPKKRKRNESN